MRDRPKESPRASAQRMTSSRLVVVAEDERAGRPARPWPRRSRRRARSGGAVGVALGERPLEPEHVVPPVGSAPIWPAGTAWSPIRGVVGLGARCVAGIPGRHGSSLGARPGPARRTGRAPRPVGRDAVGGCVQRPPTARSPTPRAPTSSSTPRAGSSTWARPSRCATGSPTTSPDPAALPLRTAQMVAQADHVEWVVVGTEVEALMLEHSLIQAHQPRFNVRLKDDKSYPWLAVTVSEEWPRPIVFAGAQAQGRPLLRPLRPRGGAARDPRPAAAELPGAHLLGRQVQAPRAAGPALPALRHRAVLGAVRRGGRPRAATAGMVEDLMRFLCRRHRGRWWPGSRPRWREAADGARVRAGGPAARPADRGAQGGRDPADGLRATRGPRRGRHRRGRARGGGAGLPRAPGPGGRARAARSPTRWRT